MDSTAGQLRSQWTNPGDILSLLLLIGREIVQMAIAQLVGYQLCLPGARGRALSIAPVAFSFGWAAYGFSNLLSAVGDMRLMPTNDLPAILVNCSNGFVREAQSWVLGRLLRDHEIRHHVDPRPEEEGGRAESIRIDIFNLGPVSKPTCDFVWWSGWVTILAQVGIAIVPWALYGDWAVLMITLTGTLLVMITCALPQWVQEKWAGRKLRHEKVTCLTRGNGHLHILVFIGAPGSWDLESLATSTLVPRAETRWISLALAVLWTCLLISVSGLKSHTWFLIGIGSIGMLQNVFAAGVSRNPAASNFQLTRFSRAPTIVGRRGVQESSADVSIDLEKDLAEFDGVSAWVSQKQPVQSSVQQSASVDQKEIAQMPSWLASMSREDGVPSWLEPRQPKRAKQPTINTGSILASPNMPSSIRRRFINENNTRHSIIHAPGVHGALMELEKWVPTAGLAMVQVFFAEGLRYNEEGMRNNAHKAFWQRAYHTKFIRQSAEEKRRAEGRVGYSVGI